MTTDPNQPDRSDRESVSEALGSQERTLMAAWTLPNHGPLSDTERRQALDNFARYIKERGISTDHVAKQIGSPKKTVIDDMVKRGIFRANCDDHIRTLNNYIEQHARQRAALRSDQKFISTRVAKDILGVAATVREDQVMGLVMGPTGIGKTRCALAVHEKYVGSVYVRVHRGPRGSHTVRGLTEALAVALKRRHGKGNVWERIIGCLEGSGRLVIVDEAHQLRSDALELLRDIHDLTGVPILLVATKDLYDRIRSGADPDHGQMYSRFAIFHHLTEDCDAGTTGRKLFTVEQIRELYNDPQIKLSVDASKYLTDMANDLGLGSLRRCDYVLRIAARHARKRSGVAYGERVTVTAEHLRHVEKKYRKLTVERDVIDHRVGTAAKAM